MGTDYDLYHFFLSGLIFHRICKLTFLSPFDKCSKLKRSKMLNHLIFLDRPSRITSVALERKEKRGDKGVKQKQKLETADSVEDLDQKASSRGGCCDKSRMEGKFQKLLSWKRILDLCSAFFYETD